MLSFVAAVKIKVSAHIHVLWISFPYGIIIRTLEVIKEGDYINVSDSLHNHTVQTYLVWAFVCSQTSDNSLVATQIHYRQRARVHSTSIDVDSY